MDNERPPGYDDVYAFIDSQFLDVPPAERLEKPEPMVAQRAMPARARTPLGPLPIQPLGQRAPAKDPPPPIPADTVPEVAAVQDKTPQPEVQQPLIEEVVEAKPTAVPAVPPRTRPKRQSQNGEMFQLNIPNIEDYLPIFSDKSRLTPTRTAIVQMEQAAAAKQQDGAAPKRQPGKPKAPRRLKRPELSGPRPRHRREASEPAFDTSHMPDLLKDLAGKGNDAVLEKYYSRSRQSSRKETFEKITNPELTLEETARLLGVCPTTVRRYTNRGWLRHHRTQGNQRRFRLSDITDFLEEFGTKKR